MADDPTKNRLPARVVKRALEIGVAAVSANLDVLDDILGEDLEDADELAKAKATWRDYPPTVVQGFSRLATTMPRISVTLSADRNIRDLLGMGEGPFFDDMEDLAGNQYRVRMMGMFTVFIWAEHPDVCMWYYRVARRILNVASSPAGYFMQRELEEAKVDGNDLIPDPQFTPENVFVRQITLSLEYWDTWTDQDAVWSALNGAAVSTDPVTVSVARRSAGGLVDQFDEET